MQSPCTYLADLKKNGFEWTIPKAENSSSCNNPTTCTHTCIISENIGTHLVIFNYASNSKLFDAISNVFQACCTPQQPVHLDLQRPCKLSRQKRKNAVNTEKVYGHDI
jgi:hypothetical protein